jgi:hypothetical protein
MWPKGYRRYDNMSNPLQFGWHSGVQFNFDKMIAGIE